MNTLKKKEGGERTTSVRARAFLIAGGAGGSWSPSRENFLVKIQSSSPNPLLSLAQVRSIFPEKCTFSKKKIFSNCLTILSKVRVSKKFRGEEIEKEKKKMMEMENVIGRGEREGRLTICILHLTIIPRASSRRQLDFPSPSPPVLTVSRVELRLILLTVIRKNGRMKKRIVPFYF